MKSLRVSLFLAARSLARSNYGIAVTTTLMMLLIYMSLLFLPSLIQGAINRVNAQLVETLTSDIVITPAGQTASIDNAGSYLAKIRGTAGVKAATDVYHAGTQVSYGARSGSWPVDPIDPVSYRAVFTTLDNIVEGRAPTPQDTGQVLLGIGIAGAGETNVRGYRASLQTVHAGARDSITLVNGRSVTFTVAGIYDNQFPQSDSNAYITTNEAGKLLPASRDRATAIYVRTRSGVNVSQEVSRLAALRSAPELPDLHGPGRRRPGPDGHLPADQQHPQDRLPADGRHHHFHDHLHRPGQQAPADRHRTCHRHQIESDRLQLRSQGLGVCPGRRGHGVRPVPVRGDAHRGPPPVPFPQRAGHPGHHLE